MTGAEHAGGVRWSILFRPPLDCRYPAESGCLIE
jgi:hypothetical protein